MIVGTKAQFAYEVVDCEGASTLFLMNWTTEGNCLIFWISYCGPKDEAEHYQYTIKIKSFKGEKQPEYLFQATRLCVPCDLSHKEMKVERSGILINHKLIQKAAGITNLKDVNPQNVIEYCIKMDKIPPREEEELKKS